MGSPVAGTALRPLRLRRGIAALRWRGKQAEESVAKTYEIAAIPGDGIGKEVVPEGMRVLEAAGRRFGFALKWRGVGWSLGGLTQTRRTDAPHRGRSAAAGPTHF